MSNHRLIDSVVATTRVFGRGPTLPGPYRHAWRHKPTFFGMVAMERWLAFARATPVDLKMLAQLRAASLVGCLW